MVAINISTLTAVLALITTITAAPVKLESDSLSVRSKLGPEFVHAGAEEGLQQINNDNDQYKAPRPNNPSGNHKNPDGQHLTGENLPRPQQPPPQAKKSRPQQS
ncbi:hypothetical protein M409DRAFT_55506 [Zasmidium cellare ATCC 36951]|uniref:Uncharacterized protein n=1 Tax=Zasmidium cellare ATCC 36951 TaxID=1080233 RepID=A0A6A6CIU0_ZASCE|nr:uncharacterized protein M409DRAFT_55506 [Zasmidium cellare ATCC 36951]KAF2165609.1 hypothetical protein M409DRAFT_55506 [Zasmidium cellare ATCC 36951]